MTEKINKKRDGSGLVHGGESLVTLIKMVEMAALGKIIER